jgi:hypothetical protein
VEVRQLSQQKNNNINININNMNHFEGLLSIELFGLKTLNNGLLQGHDNSDCNLIIPNSVNASASPDPTSALPSLSQHVALTSSHPVFAQTTPPDSDYIDNLSNYVYAPKFGGTAYELYPSETEIPNTPIPVYAQNDYSNSYDSSNELRIFCYSEDYYNNTVNSYQSIDLSANNYYTGSSDAVIYNSNYDSTPSYYDNTVMEYNDSFLNSNNLYAPNDVYDYCDSSNNVIVENNPFCEPVNDITNYAVPDVTDYGCDGSYENNVEVDTCDRGVSEFLGGADY